ncbi:MAG TPA: AbrB/MazE/SpoVT family DNA-binding domain-containing protein [Opitutales bacterium]|nr:AbrB/MazE/SpoVT family DNA-binding domain-containing protein [Opitutales bacterium]
MALTIDKAGRLVIPADLRRIAGLKPGTPLSATYEDGAIRIERDVPGPVVTTHGKRRIARPKGSGAEPINISNRIEEERNRWPI